MYHQANSPPGPLLIDLEGLHLTPQDRDLLKDPLVCGVIFFSRNFESADQLRGLTSEIRSVRPQSLLCVDQEGGRVQRFREGFTPLPALGDLLNLSQLTGLDSTELARLHASVMASELKQVGIDFSFAPVLDIDYGHNKVVADRSFGAEPGLVSRMALSYLDELNKTGMAGVAKHFPGHGYVAEDTHVGVARDYRPKSEILAADGQPFQVLIDAGVAGVMPAHVIYPDVDQRPAVQSPVWIEQILRTEMGFKGAVISDDLSMEGAGVEARIEKRVTCAVEAGCDLLLVCNNRKSLVAALQQLHQMDTDHLGEQACARRSLLRLQDTVSMPANAALEYARRVLCSWKAEGRNV